MAHRSRINTITLIDTNNHCSETEALIGVLKIHLSLVLTVKAHGILIRVSKFVQASSKGQSRCHPRRKCTLNCGNPQLDFSCIFILNNKVFSAFGRQGILRKQKCNSGSNSVFSSICNKGGNIVLENGTCSIVNIISYRKCCWGRIVVKRLSTFFSIPRIRTAEQFIRVKIMEVTHINLIDKVARAMRIITGCSSIKRDRVEVYHHAFSLIRRNEQVGIVHKGGICVCLLSLRHIKQKRQVNNIVVDNIIGAGIHFEPITCNGTTTF